MRELRSALRQLVEETSTDGGPLVVHSDLRVTRSLVPRIKDRAATLSNHVTLLSELAGSAPMWFPSFNYDFLRGERYDTRRSPCQLGPLGEFFRTERSEWRSPDPVFSICGTGSPPGMTALPSCIDPFDERSAFGDMVGRKAVVLFYGAPLSSATVIHHAERLSGGPVYRYDKRFSGEVVDDQGRSHAIEYDYHVRPRGRTLEYDWGRLEDELRERKIMSVVESDGRIVARVAAAAALVRFWTDALRRDPLCLLDTPSRDWVEPEYDRLGRRFELTDFE